MKYLLAALSITLAWSTLVAASPSAESAPVATAADAAAPLARRVELARQFIALAEPVGDMMGTIRESALLTFGSRSDAPQDESVKQAAERRVDQILARAEPTIRKRMPEVLEAYARAYAREFSAEELEQLIAFAQSPAGRHYVSRVSFVEMEPEILDAHQLLSDELTPIMREVTKELCAERAAQRLAAGDTKARCPLSGEPETASS